MSHGFSGGSQSTCLRLGMRKPGEHHSSGAPDTGKYIFRRQASEEMRRAIEASARATIPMQPASCSLTPSILCNQVALSRRL